MRDATPPTQVGTVEEEIGAIEGSQGRNPGLFKEEHTGLRSLRNGLTQFREMATGIQAELRCFPKPSN